VNFDLLVNISGCKSTFISENSYV